MGERMRGPQTREGFVQRAGIRVLILGKWGPSRDVCSSAEQCWRVSGEQGVRVAMV